MAGYVIANYEVTNGEGYQNYLATVVPTIAAHGGKILVAGSDHDGVEGSPGPVTVVLEFPSKAAARAWYDSPEYQEIVHHRTDNTDGFLVMTETFQLPS